MQKVDVLENDYERYSIPIPLSKLGGNKRQKYIFSELEKRHPCFSDEYAFDAILKPGLRGVQSDVVVIKKIKLAECRKKIGGLNLENCKKKRFARIDKVKCFLVGIIVLFSGSVFLVDRNCRKTSNISEENNESITQVEIPQEELKDGFYENTKKLLEIVKNENGKITYFSWKASCLEDELIVSLKSLYPEKIEEIMEKGKISSILYADGEPVFSYTRQERVSAREASPERTDREMFQQKIRNLILQSNCNLVEETFSPYGLKFSFFTNGESGKGDFQRFEIFRQLNELIENLGLSVESIVLKILEANNGNKYEVELCVNHKFKSDIDISVLSLYPEIFIPGNSKNQHKASVITMKNTVQKDNENFKKIGEVMYGDGTKLVFYKNHEGKLIKKKEENQ